MALFGVLLWNSQRQALWKWRVRGRFNPDELLAWYSQVRSNPPIFMGRIPWEILSNAPAYIINVEPVHVVLPVRDYIWVGYGKTGHEWGLVIGSSNFPSNDVPSHVIETWAPKIYYCSE